MAVLAIVYPGCSRRSRNRDGSCVQNARPRAIGMKPQESIGTAPPPTTPIVEKPLTYKQAGLLLGVTERPVWTPVAHGELPAVRFG